MKFQKKVVRWWVVELDGLRVDVPSGRRLGHWGVLRLPGVQAGPKTPQKVPVLVKIPLIAKSQVKEENHMQIRVM